MRELSEAKAMAVNILDTTKKTGNKRSAFKLYAKISAKEAKARRFKNG